MITTAKIHYIKDNVYFPEVGDYTDAQQNESDFRVVYTGYDGYYRVPHNVGIIHKTFYDQFIEFYEKLEDDQDFADGTTLPFVRDDTVVGPGLTTTIFYKNEVHGEMIVVGYDEYPVICLETNKDCYFYGCEDWTVEDEIIETDVHEVLSSSLGEMWVEAKVIKEQTYGLEAVGIAYDLFRDKYPNTRPDIMSVDPDDKVEYFDMPQEDIQWMEEA